MEDYVKWCDAYNHIKHGGMAQHKSWNPNCRIKLDELGEIVFQDGTECWLDIDELTSDEWIILPSGNVWETFDEFPNLGKTLTINLVTTKLWHEKGKLHRKLYDFYQEKGSLSVLKGGWCVGYRENLGFTIVLDTAFNPLTIYSSNYLDVEKAIETFKSDFTRVIELEKILTSVRTGLLEVEELKRIYVKISEMK